MEQLAEGPIRLRPGLEVVRTGPRSFLLLGQDAVDLFELGADERYMLHLLEQSGSLDEALKGFESRFGRSLSRRHLLEFIEQLRRLDLLEGAHRDAGSVPSPREPRSSGEPAAVAPAPVPLSGSDPGANLNLVFDLLVVLFGWILHPFWIAPILLLAALATLSIAQNWHQFLADLAAPGKSLPPFPCMLLLTAQTLVFMNLPRIVLIGVASRRFGGRIHRFGLKMLGGVVPAFYCDFDPWVVSKSDRGRWTLITIDIWYRLAVGAFSIVLWRASRPGSTAAMFWIWMVPMCIAGLIYHCLIYSEYCASYWALCKAVDEPQLRERALAETSAWIGWRRSPEALTAGQRYWFRAYGLSYYLFRVVVDPLVLYFLGDWLVTSYDRNGALIFVAAVLWFYRHQLETLLMENAAFRWLVRCGGHWWVRWPARLALVALIVVLGFMPYNFEIVGECRVVALAEQGVRAHLDDRIVDVYVSEGDQVEPGSLIALLGGNKVKSDVETASAELAKARATLALLRNGNRPQDIQMAIDEVDLQTIQLGHLSREVARDETLTEQRMASASQIDQHRTERDSVREKLSSARENLTKTKEGARPEEIEAAAADVRLLEEKLRYAESRLELVEVTAPIRGRISTPYMEARKGQITRSGDLIAVVQDTSRLRVEVAADDAAALTVKKGMPVKVRLSGMYGRLLNGRVAYIAPAVEPNNKFGNASFRTDQETYAEQSTNSRSQDTSYQLRVYVDLDRYPPELTTDMTGYARIVVGEDVLWRAVARPIARFVLTEVWSWLP